MAKRYDKAFKEEVLGKVRSGGKVREVAVSYGLSEMTIRTWLKREVTASSDVLTLSRLHRENEALYRLVGQLVYESSREKKVAVASASSNKAQAARELGVSRSSLYYLRKLPCKDDELRGEIEALMKVHPGYGYRRMAIALSVNHKRVQRVMQKYHLKPLRRAKMPKKGNRCTTSVLPAPLIIA